MVLDHSFFALMFLLASALSPSDAPSLVLENTRHPEQRMVWTRADDGRWAMTINGRDMGHFAREADAVVHHTGVQSPDRYPVNRLADRRDLRRDATQVRLRGNHAGVTVRVIREEGRTRRLEDPSRRVLPVPLRVR